MPSASDMLAPLDQPRPTTVWSSGLPALAEAIRSDGGEHPRRGPADQGSHRRAATTRFRPSSTPAADRPASGGTAGGPDEKRVRTPPAMGNAAGRGGRPD